MSLRRILTSGIPVAIAVVLTGSEMVLGAGSGMFGKVPTYNSDTGFTLWFSDDKKAFTAVFSNLLAQLRAKSPQPITTRTFSFSLPLSDLDAGAEFPFFVSGYAFCDKGASTHVIFTVNDQTTVADFPENTDAEFVQELKYKAGATPSEIRVTINIVADQDSKSGGDAYLDVLAIDTDLLNRLDKQNLLKKVKEKELSKKRSGGR
jgi:hypothetical protein